MYKIKNRIISALACCFIFLFLLSGFSKPALAEVTGDSDISSAKGSGFLNLAQRWDNKYVNGTYGQKYKNDKEVVGYYTKDWSADSGSHDSLQKNADKITGVATFSYQVNYSGQIVGEAPKSALKTSYNHNIETLALVHNLSSTGFNRELIHSILSNPTTRSQTASNIYKTLVKNGFDGVQIDFENVPAKDREYFNAFLDDLKDKLTPDGLKLTIAVPAKTYDDTTSAWGGAYDYGHISSSADRIMLMAYDEHWIGGAPGPVASQPWVQKVVDYSSQVIPKDKLLLGVGSYGYDWIVGKGGYKTVPAKNAVSMAMAHGSSILWDSYNQAPYYYYWKGGQKHIVWFESAQSAAMKLDMVNKFGLKGIAVWKLGFEAPDFWTMVVEKLKLDV